MTDAPTRRRDSLLEQARTLTGTSGEPLSREQQDEFDTIETELRDINERIQRRAELAEQYRAGRLPVIPAEHPDRDPIRHRRDLNPDQTTWVEYRQRDGHLPAPELRARAFDAAECLSGGTDRIREAATRLLERNQDPNIADWMLATSDPHYLSAFSQLIRGRTVLTSEEVDAVRRVERAVAIGTDNVGGYAVPTILDPIWITIGAGSVTDVVDVARREIIGTSAWTGVGVTEIVASWDGEATEVSDDTPTFSQPSIDVHNARAFVPMSIEALDDVPNLTEQTAAELQAAIRRLLNTAAATGSGTGQPTGFVTALTGSSQEVASATTDVFAVEDVYSTKQTLPDRYKDSGARPYWVGHEDIYDEIRKFGTSDSHALWTRLGDGMPERLLGYPTAVTSAMDSTVDAATENYVLGLVDMYSFVIVQRVGTRIELIGHLFGTSNNRPTGQRGLYAHSRLGSGFTTGAAATLPGSLLTVT